jgi:hypothetical protein
VTFHVRRIEAGQQDRHAHPSIGALPPGLIESSNGHAPGLLGTMSIAGYVPLNSGLPYGSGLRGLDTIRDGRFAPAQTPSQDLDLQVTGPCSVAVFASVHQTDPATRINWAGSKDITDGLGPENRFWVRFNTARYWRVGAEMTVDLCTWDSQGWCPDEKCPGNKNPDVKCAHRPTGARELMLK